MGLVQIIEELREELVQLGIIKGLQDPEVIRLSQILDEYINDYYRTTRRSIYGNINIIKKRPTKKSNYVTEYPRRRIPYHAKVIRD